MAELYGEKYYFCKVAVENVRCHYVYICKISGIHIGGYVQVIWGIDSTLMSATASATVPMEDQREVPITFIVHNRSAILCGSQQRLPELHWTVSVFFLQIKGGIFMSSEIMQETTPLVECSAFHRGMSVLEASLRNTEDSDAIISGLLEGCG